MDSSFNIDDDGCELLVTLDKKDIKRILKECTNKKDASVNAFGICLVIAVTNMFDAVAGSLKAEKTPEMLDNLAKALTKHFNNNIRIALDEADKNYTGEEDE